MSQSVQFGTYRRGFVFKIGPSSDAESKSGSLIFTKDHNMDAVQLLWWKDRQ